MTIQNVFSTIRSARFDFSTGKLMKNDEKYFRDLMNSKFKYGESENTGWFVSNCNNTSGATKRFQFAQKLLTAGLKVKYKTHNFQKRFLDS